MVENVDGFHDRRDDRVAAVECDGYEGGRVDGKERTDSKLAASKPRAKEAQRLKPKPKSTALACIAKPKAGHSELVMSVGRGTVDRWDRRPH